MTRQADHPVHDLFVERWSPRSFTGEAVPDDVLLTVLEAARWAPSAMNAQPWRFLVARPGDAAWDDFVALLAPRNRLWATRAGALFVIVSDTEVEWRGASTFNVSHSFDTGAAWASLALQAQLLGWHTHGIGGFDRELARTRLAIPKRFAVEAMVALGKRAGLDQLPADFHDQETPNSRRPLAETVFEGRFGSPLNPQKRSAA